MAIEARELTIVQRVADVLRTIDGTGAYWVDLSERVAILDPSIEQESAADQPLILVLQQTISPGEGDEVHEFDVAIQCTLQPEFWASRSWTAEQAILRLHSDCMRALRSYRGLDPGGEESPLYGGANSIYQGSSFLDPESQSVVAGFTIRWRYSYAMEGMPPW